MNATWTRHIYRMLKGHWAKGFSDAQNSAQIKDWVLGFSDINGRLLNEHLETVFKCGGPRQAQTALAIFLCALDKDTLDMLKLTMAQVQIVEAEEPEHAIQ